MARTAGSLSKGDRGAGLAVAEVGEAGADGVGAVAVVSGGVEGGVDSGVEGAWAVECDSDEDVAGVDSDAHPDIARLATVSMLNIKAALRSNVASPVGRSTDHTMPTIC